MASGEPPEKDMKDFEFVQLCKFRVSEPSLTPPTLERSQMLACSSLYGLVMFATKTGFSVGSTSDFLSIDESTGAHRNKVTIEDIPVIAKVMLPSPAHFLSLSGDGTFLSVVFKSDGQTNLVFFDVHGFADKMTSPQPFGKLQGLSVVDVAWNPTVFNMLAVCYSDGSMALVDVKDAPRVIAALPPAVGALCMSWSPKGKQLLVGKKDGTLSQYDHALTEKKRWPCPSMFSEPQTVLDVVWLSTYSFIGAYLSAAAQESDQPTVVMTNSNKEGNSTFINFDDVCFSSGEDRRPQYLFHNIQKWEVVLMASSRATEVTLVGKNLDNKVSWEHWNLEDSCRAELPLTGDKCDSFPLGLAVDYSPQKTVSLSETKTFPACPVMFLLSSDGLLLAYHLHYSHREAGQITTPAQGLNPGQARKGVPGLLGKPASAPTTAPIPPQEQAKPSLFPSRTVPAAPVTVPPSLFGGAPNTTAPATGADSGKNIFNMFGAPSPAGNNPASTAAPIQSSFQFGKASDAAAAFSSPAAGTTAANQKPSLLSMPSGGVNPSQAQQAQGQPQGQPISSSFSFSFAGGGNTTNNTGQNSAFASIPPSSQSAATGFNFGQTPTGPSIFGGGPSTPVSKPSTAPFMPPKQATPPTQQQVTPPSNKPPGSSAGGIFQMKAPDSSQQQPKADGLTKTPQQPSGTPESHQQQRPTSSIFGVGAPLGSKPVTPFSINNSGTPTARPTPPPTGAGVVGSQNVGVTKPIGGPQAAQVKGSPLPQRAPESGNASIEATVDGAFSQNIIEEVVHFEEEMKKFRLRSRREVKVVGTRTEMQSLRRDTEETVNLLSEIKDAVKDQLHESHDMKSSCLNLSADVEKSRTQLQRNSDPHYHSLLQGRALDPASAKQLQEIQQMAQLLEQTLSEVNHTLDSQWEQHLAQRSRQRRLSTPTGDAIYKSIKNNNQIICHQKRNLEKLEEKMSNLRLGSKHDRSSSTVYNLVAEDSPRASGKQEYSPGSGSKKLLSLKEAVAKGMTPEKVSRLKEILAHRKVPLVKPKTPATLSSSRIVATPRRPIGGASPSSIPKAAATTSAATRATINPQQHGQTPPPPPQQQQHPMQKALFGNAAIAAAYQKTPCGIPSTELRLPKGPLPAPDMAKPNTQPSMFGGSGGAGIGGGSGSMQRVGGLGLPQPQQKPPPMMMAGAPTSFSGVAYFKQPPAATTPPPAPPAAATGLSPSQLIKQQQLLQRQQQQLPLDLQAATQVLSKHLPAMFGASGHPQQQYPQQQHQHPQPPEYEDITPTETEEDEDDEEDYDEEDGGYEDEDEYEEEEEDYVGGGGDGSEGFGTVKSFFPVKTMTGEVKGSSGVSSGGGAVSNTTVFGSSGGTTTIFGGSSGDKTAAPSSTPASLSATVTTNTAASGFAFGGTSSTFGQNVSTVSSSGTGTTPVFGGAAGGGGGSSLSRSVGFADLAKGSGETSTSATSPSVFGGNVTSPGSTFAFNTTPSSTLQGAGNTTSPVTAKTPPSSSAAGFSFLAAATASGGGGGGGGSLFGGTGKSPSVSSPNGAGVQQQTSPTSLSPSDKPKSPPASPNGSQQPGTPAGNGSANTAAAAKTPPALGISAFNTTPPPYAQTGGTSAGQGSVSPEVKSSTAASSPFTSVGGTTAVPSAVSSSVSTTSPLPTVAAAAAASTSVFGTGNTSASSSSLFGGGSTPATSSIFGGGSAATTTSSIFGGVSSTTTTSSIFGGGSTATTTSSIFGSGSTATTTSSIFGGGSAATTSSVFGGGPSNTTAAASPSFFGSGSASTTSAAASTTPDSTSSPFFGGASSGGATTPQTTSSSIFGNTAATTGNTPAASTPSIFGLSSSSSATSKPPLFGSTTASPAASSAPSVFGALNLTTSSGSNAASVFGSQTSSTAASSSIFGQGGGVPPATTSAIPASSSSSVFGKTDSNSAGTGFAFNTQPAAGSTFGSSGGFGSGMTTSDTSSTFSFNQPPSTTSNEGGGAGSLFGGFGGLGAKPSEEKANTNVFGSPQTFGSPTAQNGLFGSSSSSPFGGSAFGGGSAGTGSTPSVFGGGSTAGASFSGANAGVSSTGFGVNNTSASAMSGGFGSTPAFGSAPSFGGGSAFGGGAKPAGFGSPSSVFGGGATFGSAAPFGSAASTGAGTGGNGGGGGGGVFGSNAATGNNTALPGFGSFASSAAPSFGQLAQSSSTGFGNAGAPGGGFGGAGGGGGGAPASPFGGAGGGGGGGGNNGAFGGTPVFGQSPAGGGSGFGSPQPGFGGGQSTGFGSSPAFSSYRG